MGTNDYITKLSEDWWQSFRQTKVDIFIRLVVEFYRRVAG